MNPLKIRIRIGFHWLLLDPTPENMKLVTTLAATTIYDDVYDIDYNEKTYHPVGNTLDIQFDRPLIDDSVSAKDANAVIDAARAARNAAREAEATPALAEAAE